jgi:hypothetical protein
MYHLRLQLRCPHNLSDETRQVEFTKALLGRRGWQPKTNAIRHTVLGTEFSYTYDPSNDDPEWGGRSDFEHIEGAMSWMHIIEGEMTAAGIAPGLLRVAFTENVRDVRLIGEAKAREIALSLCYD